MNIVNQLIIENDASHEYWGSINGNWIDGPNDNFYAIQDSSFNFLYNILNSYQLGDLNQDFSIDVLDVIILVNSILGSGNNIQYDLNSDGIVNILDVIEIINLVLLD